MDLKAFKEVAAKVRTQASKLLTKGSLSSLSVSLEKAVGVIKSLLPPQAARHVDKELLLCLLVLLILGLVMAAGQTRLLVNIAGFVYPSYKVLEVLQGDMASPKRWQSKKAWLSYLMLFTLLLTLEVYLDIVIRHIFAYSFLKLGLLLYLYNPLSQGATAIYDAARPWTLKAVTVIDDVFASETDAAPHAAAGGGDGGSAAKGTGKGKGTGDKDDKDKAPSSPQKAASPAPSSSSSAATPSKLHPACISIVLQSVSVSGYLPVEPAEDGKSQDLQCSVYCELTLVPPSERASQGVEGIVYKSHTLACPIDTGFSVYFNHPLKLTPVYALDGTLRIEVKEKPTFENTKTVAEYSVSLLDVPLGGGAVVKTLGASGGTQTKLSISVDV